MLSRDNQQLLTNCRLLWVFKSASGYALLISFTALSSQLVLINHIKIFKKKIMVCTILKCYRENKMLYGEYLLDKCLTVKNKTCLFMSYFVNKQARFMSL